MRNIAASAWCWGYGLYSWWSENYINCFAALGFVFAAGSALNLFLLMFNL